MDGRVARRIGSRPWVAGSVSCAMLVTALYAVPAQAAELRIGPPPWDLRPTVRWALETLASHYEQEHPGVGVEVTAGLVGFDAATVRSEDLGDIMFVPGAEYGHASILAILVERGLCLDLTERVQSPEFGKDDFLPNLWDLVTVNNRTWAVPLLVRSWGLAVDGGQVDADWFKQTARTWQGLLNCQAGLLTDHDGDGRPEQSAIRCGLSPYTLWASVFLALGGDPSDTQSFTAGSEAWQGAVSYVAQLGDVNPLLFDTPSTPRAVGLRYQPAVQFVHDDRGGRTSFQDRAGRSAGWELVAAPGTGPIPPLDTTVIAIRRSTPETDEAAWAFVRWVTSAPVMGELMPLYGLTPIRRSLVEASKDPAGSFFASQIERMRFQWPRATADPEAVALRAKLLAGVGREAIAQN